MTPYQPRHRAARPAEAGFGGHEVRCLVAACAAMTSLGTSMAASATSSAAALLAAKATAGDALHVVESTRPHLDYYRVVPEWITGMGLMTTEPFGVE